MTLPERLGKYAIRRVLGKGAMGTVYLGFDPDIEREVAIKTIRKDLIDQELVPEFMARFRNEARAAGRLHHPNIVGVYEYGDDAVVTYIAMEYVDGSGLRDYVRDQTGFTFGRLVDMMTQLLDALDYAHERGVVHRDIKPSNLLMTRRGTLKVADFGIARIDRSNLTSLGMVIGTPSYMSPEQCRGEETDARSDLFSAGVVLYELLTGEKPFPGPLESMAYRICHEDAAPPSKHPALKLPAATDQLMATALAKDPAARFASAAAFRDALKDLAKLDVEVDAGQGTTVVNFGTVMLRRPPPAWDDATLDSVEHELARIIGPVARVLVHKAAVISRDHEELCSLLSENIDDPDTRRKFVDAVSKGTAGSKRARGSTARSAAVASASLPSKGGSMVQPVHDVPLDDAFVERVTALLAVRIGPIARVIARRAAQQARGRDGFVRIVVENLDEDERKAFFEAAAKR